MRSSAVTIVGLLALLASSPGFGREVAGVPAPAPRSAPRTEFFGLRVGTSEAEAHRRLRALGTPSELESEKGEPGGEGLERELWALRDPEFRYLLLGIEKGRVVALQVYARPGRHARRYHDIGDLASARKLGFYIYQWKVPGENGEPGLCVEARGSDPEYLGSCSVVRDPVRESAAASVPDITRTGARSGSDPD